MQPTLALGLPVLHHLQAAYRDVLIHAVLRHPSKQHRCVGVHGSSPSGPRGLRHLCCALRALCARSSSALPTGTSGIFGFISSGPFIALVLFGRVLVATTYRVRATYHPTPIALRRFVRRRMKIASYVARLLRSDFYVTHTRSPKMSGLSSWR